MVVGKPVTGGAITSRRPDAKRFRLQLLVVLGVLSAVAPMATDIYLPAFPDVATSLGVDVSAVQLTLSASLLGMGLGQLQYGPLSDRFGRRKPLIGGLIVFVLACLGCAVATDLWVLVLLRFIAAVGGASGMVISRAIVRDCFSGIEIARMLSAMMMVFALAPVLGPLAGAAVLAVASWPWIFVVLAGFGLACLLGTLSLPETLEADRRTRHGFLDAMRAYREISCSRDIRIFGLISAMASVVLFAYIASSPAVFMDEYGVSPSVYGLLFGVNSVFLIAGGQVNMVLLRSRTPRQLIMLYAAVQSVSCILLTVAAVTNMPLPALLAPLFVASAAFGGISANAMAEALHPFPHNAASAAALVGTVSMTAGAGIAAVTAATGIDAGIQMGIAMFIGALATLVLAMLSTRPSSEVKQGTA